RRAHIDTHTGLRVKETAGLREVIRADDEPSIRVVREEVKLRVKRDLEFVMVNKDVYHPGPGERQEIFKALAGSVLDVHTDGEPHSTPAADEISQAGQQVTCAGP